MFGHCIYICWLCLLLFAERVSSTLCDRFALLGWRSNGVLFDVCVCMNIVLLLCCVIYNRSVYIYSSFGALLQYIYIYVLDGFGLIASFKVQLELNAFHFWSAKFRSIYNGSIMTHFTQNIVQSLSVSFVKYIYNVFRSFTINCEYNHVEFVFQLEIIP